MGFEVPHEGGIILEDGDWKVVTVITHTCTLVTDTSFSQLTIDVARGEMPEGWQVT